MAAKVISFVNQKGGVGKSILCDELAFEFDRLGVSYNLYDLDGQGGLLHEESDNSKANYWLVDTPGQLVDEVLDAIKQSDVIIVPTRASMKEMEPFERTLNIIKSSKKKKAAVIIVLNGWNKYTTYTQFEEWLKSEYPEFDKIVTLPHSEILAQAQSYNKSIIDYKSSNPVSNQLKKLWAIVEYELGFKL